MQATDKGIVRGASTGSGSSSVSQSKTAASTSSPPASPPPSSLIAPSAPAASTPAVKVDTKMLAYSQQVVQKYDTNGDGTLTKSEWVVMNKDPSAADTDGDGKITPTEHAVWTASR